MRCFVLAGRDASGDKVVIALVGDDPDTETVMRVDFLAANPPWGAGAFCEVEYGSWGAVRKDGRGVVK